MFLKICRVLWIIVVISTFAGMATVLHKMYVGEYNINAVQPNDVPYSMPPYTDYTIEIYTEDTPINIYEFLDSHNHHCLVIKFANEVALSCENH